MRYIGIDAPEAGATCGDEATDLNADLVEGQTVRLVRDVSPVDQHNFDGDHDGVGCESD